MNKSLLLSCLIVYMGFGSSVYAEDKKLNIIIILADDLGIGDVGCYGAEDIRTPHIDQMAKNGTKFTQFNVAQPVCTASRAALLSGCYPNRLGMAGALNHTSTIGIHPAEELLPELLKRQGYATACFGKWHLGTLPEFFPTKNGFDTWAGLPYSNDNGPLHPTVRGIPALPWYTNDTITERDPDQSTFTTRITDQGIAFIKANHTKPFFLYLPHIMPHVPIAASAAFRGKSARGLYGDAVEELDASLGRLLNTVRELKIESHTIILFLSDNGPFLSYGNHAGSAGPYREGKLTTFEGGVRVPFLAVCPGRIPAGRVSDAFITGLDLLPTLAMLTKFDMPKFKIDGVDLSDALLGQQTAKERSSFAYFSGADLHAVRSGRWKLHVPHDYLTVNGTPGVDGKPANYANMKPNVIEQSGILGIASRHGYRVEKLELSLFDLDTDPGERVNVAANHPSEVKRLLALVEEYRKDLGDPLTKREGSGLRQPGRAVVPTK